jgi:glyoxylase-like metal-dependent hydrolase (beta-lactamase superfamily II)
MPDQYLIIEGNRVNMDGGGMFSSVPKALWQKWFISDDNNQIRFATRCLVAKTNDLTILMEAGAGAYMEPKMADRYALDTSENKLITNLAENDISEESVDYVILSHLHFDHVGGLVPTWPGTQDDNWSLHFPNAKYVISRTQFERAHNPHPRDRASYIKDLCEKLENSGRLILIDEDSTGVAELDGLISFEFTNGHTPGLLHSLLHMNGETLFFASDLIPGNAWIHLPITAGYDRNPELVVDEKAEILKRAIKENWIIVFTHDPEIAMTRVSVDEATGKYQPVAI